MNEQQEIEFKSQWSDTVLRTACAFANTNGGIIYIGIDDDGNPVELKKPHASCLCNPLLADIFYKAGYIESWGRGTLNIIDYCTSTNLPEPEMSEEMNGFLLIIHKYVESSEKVPETTQKNPRKVPEKSQKILNALKENPYLSRKQLALNLGESEDTIQSQLRKLQKEGIIKRIGPDRGGYWEVVK